MKHYIVYYQEYEEDTKLIAVCHARADAEELLLTIMEETEYQDYLFRCVQYRDYSSLEEYLKCRRGAMEYHNNVIKEMNGEGYKTLEGYDLVINGREYYIEEVEVY